MRDSLDADLRESFPSAQVPQTERINDIEVAKENGKEQHASVPIVTHITAQRTVPSRTSTPNAFSSSISSERSVVLDLSHTFTPVSRTPEPSAPISEEPKDDQVPEQFADRGRPPPNSGETKCSRPRQISRQAYTPDSEAILRTLRKAIQARQQFSRQTREQRVNPILISNRSKVDPRPKRETSNPDDLIKEGLGPCSSR